jgi:hypothetical protein
MPQPFSLRQRGRLRTDSRSSRWLTFDAEHIVGPAVGFVWNARVAVAPLVHLRVRDALVEGEGSGQVSLCSVLLMASRVGGAEMNSGSLHRYLAEAVWHPWGLYPSDRLTWTAIDDTRALASLTDAGTTVSLEFRFAENGEVVGIYTPGRWGAFDGGFQRIAWEGHFRNYQPRSGMVVPTEAEVGWYVDGAWQPVWEGQITLVATLTSQDTTAPAE